MPAAPAEYRRPRPRLSDGSLSLAFSLKLRGHEIRVKLLLHRMDRTYRPTRHYARPPDSAATEFTIGTIELAGKIKKGQFKIGKLGGRRAMPQEIWQAALAA